MSIIQHSPAHDSRLSFEVRRSLEKVLISPLTSTICIKVKSGCVTLTGIVFSEQDKMRISSAATALAGEGNVINELDVIDEMV